jgi:hypothetical protein
MTTYDIGEINQRVTRFADVFAPDAIDALLAACDEAMFEEGESSERFRLMLKVYTMEAVIARMKQRAEELYEEALSK